MDLLYAGYGSGRTEIEIKIIEEGYFTLPMFPSSIANQLP